MLSNLFTILFRFALLLLIQVLILNRVEVPYLFSPFIMPLFIIRLPIETPRWLLLLLAFGAGIVLDAFSDSMGIQAASLVACAFTRQYIFYLFRPGGGYEPSHRPVMSVMGTRWFVSVTIAMVLLHHLLFYLIQIFSAGLFLHLFIKIMGTACLSVLLILLSEFLFYRPRSRAT